MLREVLGVSQDANHFEDAPCTDLSLNLWDPQLEWETQKEARRRQKLGAQVCREDCRAVAACLARRDRLHAAGRKTGGVWGGQIPGGAK